MLAFLSTIVLARLLGADGYGSYTFAVAFLGLVSLVALLGLDQLTTRELAVAFHEGALGLARGFLRWTTTTVAGSSLAVFALGQGLLWWDPFGWAPDHVRTARVMLLALPLVTFLRLGRARLQSIDKAPLGIFLELTLWNLAILAGAAGLWLLGRTDPVDAAWIQVLAFAVALACILWAFHRFAPRRTEAADTHDGWARMGLHFTFYAIAGFLLMQADVLLMGTIGTPEETGAYGVAARSAGLALLVLGPLQQILAPRIARAWRRGDKSEAASIARRCARLSLIGTVPFLLVYGFVPELFLRLFGAAYVQAAWSLRFLTIAQLLLFALGPVQMSLAMTDKERFATTLTVGGLALGLPLAYLLYAPFGITGVAMGRVAAVAVVAVGGWWMLRRGGFRGAPWPVRDATRMP